MIDLELEPKLICFQSLNPDLCCSQKMNSVSPWYPYRITGDWPLCLSLHFPVHFMFPPCLLCSFGSHHTTRLHLNVESLCCFLNTLKVYFYSTPPH